MQNVTGEGGPSTAAPCKAATLSSAHSLIHALLTRCWRRDAVVTTYCRRMEDRLALMLLLLGQNQGQSGEQRREGRGLLQLLVYRRVAHIQTSDLHSLVGLLLLRLAHSFIFLSFLSFLFLSFFCLFFFFSGCLFIESTHHPYYHSCRMVALLIYVGCGWLQIHHFLLLRHTGVNLLECL